MLVTTTAEAVSFNVNGLSLRKSVDSFTARRNSRLVRQGWDRSCGAAALSSVLTHYLDRPSSELAIVVSLLHNTDPQRVREQGGFSLLDLKRYAEAVGFSAKGYGGLSVEDLVRFGVTSIVAVRIRGYDHFVVFKGRIGDHVLIGDPAFGNLTLTIDKFLTIWPNGIGFVVDRIARAEKEHAELAPDTMGLSIINLNALSRFITQGGGTPQLRLPPILLR